MSIKAKRIGPEQLINHLGRITVRNDSGADIDADELVTVSGITTGGGHLTVELARDGVTDENGIFIAAHAIPDGEVGTIAKWAILEGVDTSGAAADGDALYLSDATPGAWTATAPVGSPITVGKVIAKHASTGVAFLFPLV